MPSCDGYHHSAGVSLHDTAKNNDLLCCGLKKKNNLGVNEPNPHGHSMSHGYGSKALYPFVHIKL
jgi:hypothetical protein